MAFFLDTSIQYKRFFCHSKEKGKLKAACFNARLLSSKYVLMEYKRGMLAGFILFYSFVKEEKSIDDAYARFSNLYSGREKSIILSLTGRLIKEGYIKKDKNQLLRRLERYIDWELIDIFEDGVRYIADKINCRLSNATATSDYVNFTKQLYCRKTDNQCNIEYFMKINERNLKRIYKDSQSSHNREFTEMGTLYKSVLDNFSESKGNNCKKLGDVVIALECPRRDIILTTDNIFEDIGRAIKKRVNKLVF